MSADGLTFAVGARQNDGNGTDSGHVRVYTFNEISKQFTPLGVDIDGERAGDLFGSSVSLSANGTTLVVGAPLNDDNGISCGHVRVFKFNSITNRFQQVGPDINGEATLDNFGASVSISGDGSRFIVGAPFNAGNGPNAGHVRIYNFNSNTNTATQLGADINGEAFDRFGTSVSISADGSTFVAGGILNNGINGSDTGNVRVFKFNSGSNNFTQIGPDIDGEAVSDAFGSSVSMSSDGSRFVVGAPANDGNGIDAGHVRVYNFNSSSNSYTQLGLDIDGEAINDRFGTSVSISPDGTTIVVGTPFNDGNGRDSGHVRVYTFNTNKNNFEQVGLDIDGEAAGDGFGSSVSISSDGKKIVVGAQRNDGNGADSGHVRLFEYLINPSAPTQAPTIGTPVNPLTTCGIFGLNFFCPRSGKCGFFRRLLSLNGCV